MERWKRLETLLDRVSHTSLDRLSGDEIFELGNLYRSTVSDLAIARRDYPDDRASTYLNALVARAHPLIYRERPMSVARIGRFVRYGFPAAFRRSGAYTAVAFLLFAISALISGVLVALRPAIADVLLPGEASYLRGVMRHHHLWVKSATENHSVAANFIMVNNIQVAFFAFAGGMLLGLGSVYVMTSNGISLGAVGAMVAQYHLSRSFWSFVLPHGVIELSVIFMAGGAGLLMGDALLRPGLQSRGDALSTAGGVAVRVLLGCVPLLVIAGTIEGFFSPSDAPDLSKWIFAAVAGSLLYLYLLRSRPKVRSQPYRFDRLLDDSGTPDPPPQIPAAPGAKGRFGP